MKTFHFNQFFKKQFLIVLMLFTTILILPAYAQVEGIIFDDTVTKAKSFYENNTDGMTVRGMVEPDALTFNSFIGENAGDNFGGSVSFAGDLNGDGYDDIVIAAPYYDIVQSEGKVYIFFGGPSMDYIPDLTIIGENQDDQFGICVASAGDVNGDGYGDIIVGATGYDYEGINQVGKAYIFFGGESMDTTPDVTMLGEFSNGNFGSSLASAGDVNGDGINDIIIGSRLALAGDYGRAYLYFGSTTLSGTISPDKIWTGESADDYFGQSVSSAGDVNGDGFGDIIIGADHDDDVAVNAGAAYIYFGGAGSTAGTDSLKLTGEAYSNWYGNSVSGAGDVNGDGYSDVIVGAYNYNNTSPNSQGRAYIYYGGSSMDVIADLIMDGENENDEFGYSVAGGRDINGDGFSDFIVGARFWTNEISHNKGRVYVYYGGIGADNIPDIVLDQESEGGLYFGTSISSVGDVNADGFSDILIGAPLFSSQKGKAFLYKFSATGLTVPSLVITGDSFDEFGTSVSEAGDLNGDGYDDFIVGAPFYNSSGAAYVFFGGDIINSVPGLILTEGITNEQFGFSVSGAGDINGDGYDDVLVGAPDSDYGATGAGRVFIYLGGDPMNDVMDAFIYGTAVDLELGIDVSAAGDINDDGFDDYIIGAQGFSSNTGAAYIFEGSDPLNLTPIISLFGEAINDDFGISVSGAGDLNGDGYSDVVVGASGNDFGGSSAGRAYIYFGGIIMDDLADVVTTGEAEGNNFGTSVSRAGDVNNDGFNDVIIGAEYNDDGGHLAGKSYIFLGGLAMDNIPDVTFTGESPEAYFGNSVDCAGDINGDGFDDIIIGAKWNDEVGMNAGKSYVYFGSTSMDNDVDLVMKAESLGELFGTSVSTIGDYNNDDLDDFVIGAPGAVTYSGKAYLYLSSFPPVSPNLVFVKDVPYDQGGYVQLKWARSGYDVPGISKITQYLIQRSFPPSEAGFFWETIGALPATHELFYSYVASTPNDSMTNNGGTFYFRITAQTASPEEYWRSNIMYGHSVDNLAPLPPVSFYALKQGDDVKLGWQQNTETDFKDYVLYRVNDPLANLDTLEIFAIVSDTTYLDTNPLSGNAYYFLRAQDIHNNLSPAVQDSITDQTTFTLSVIVSNGWNMVSIPGINPEGMDVGNWWPDLIGQVFKFLPGFGYSPVTTTSTTEGYWLKNDGPTVYNFPAIEIVTHDPIAVSGGWNLIGGYEDVVDVNTLITNPEGQLVLPIYEYVAGSGYAAATTLDPGYGYWVKVTANCNIIIPDVVTKAGSGELPAYFKKDWGKIKITDAAGNNFALYGVDGEVNLDNYELPPLPPTGVFDIRYRSGRVAEHINSSGQTIEMRGVAYPVTVRVEGMDVTLRDITGREVNAKLKSGEEVVIRDQRIEKLIVEAEAIPTVYALEQNYPNPFNPSTVIEFSLPEDVEQVKLSIYNALGEKLAELVNGSLTAGKYSYMWNAQNVATGMYIYELRTDKYVSVKKMILLR